MAEVTITCPHCGTSLTGDSAFLGQEVGCPECGQNFIAAVSAGLSEGPEPVSAASQSISPGRRSVRDSVFTKTELAVIKSPIPRRQPLKPAGPSSSDDGASAFSARRPAPAAARKKKSFDQRFGLGTPRVFKLTSGFWTFFSLGVLIFSLGVFTVFDASGYDGQYKDWGGIRMSEQKRKWDASVGESSYAVARNTVTMCEGLKCINRNISNIGGHYQGLHEMFIGFMLIFGSGFFFFCALISFLYSARMPEDHSEKDAAS